MNNTEKDRWIDTFLDRRISFKSFEFKLVDFLFVMVLWVFALLVRVKLFPTLSADYCGFLEGWMNQIKILGCSKFLAGNTTNYTSPYLYLMCLVSGFEDSLSALKSISVFFDYSAACAVFAIIWELTKNIRKAIIGMSILLLCPATIIDGAYWCQCDIVYASFILWSLYFFFKKKGNLCFIMLGIAFAFKLQALFILPFYIIMWLKNRNVSLIKILYLPAVYAIAHIPALICGRPIKEIFSVYIGQSGMYPWGTLQYPNVYVLLDETMDADHWSTEVCSAGIVFAIIVLGFVAYYLYTSKTVLTDEVIILTALFTVAVSVYLLPHMHDRYGFLIDIISIIYVVLKPRKLPVLCVVFFATTLTFMPYLIGVRIIEPRVLAYCQTALVAYLGYDLYKSVSDNKTEIAG